MEKAVKRGFIVGYVGATMDCPHAGHVHLLKEAKKRCDYLIVALNTDEFIEQFKGKKPAMSLGERMEVVGNLRMVDKITYNESGQDSKPMLLKYDPDLIFIGDDYNFESYCKQMQFSQNWLDEHQMQVIFIPRLPNLSTTEIKRRIRA